jgi:hypothetical protein
MTLPLQNRTLQIKSKEKAIGATNKWESWRTISRNFVCNSNTTDKRKKHNQRLYYIRINTNKETGEQDIFSVLSKSIVQPK